MFVIIGAVIVLACVFGAYSVHGNLLILIQPIEFIIILGAALGAFIIGNTKTNIKQTLKGLKRALKGPTYKKADYIELLSVLYQLFKLAKTKGMLALEQHVEKPDESTLFNQFPKFLKDHHALEFLCDYLRMMTLGTENPNEVETLMDAELETHHQELHGASHASQWEDDITPFDDIAERTTIAFWDATLNGNAPAFTRLQQDATVPGLSSIVAKDTTTP